MEASRRLFQEAQRYIPGGVNSPVRAFRAVGGEPLFILRGEGPHLIDADDNFYLDYVMSWGPLILGHAPPPVLRELREALGRGTTFGAPTLQEIELAKVICEAVPSIEKVRFVSSGTEATMSAVRLARAYTGRAKILKFAGCYHGHADAFLVQAGSGVATLGLPDSPGVPPGAVQDTLTAGYNDLEAIEELFARYPEEIAAVILEPVAANMGVVPPRPGFLEGVRRLTKEHGALLIFDEVITGFRVAYGGAQALYGVSPDLTCLGKIIGGGLPVGAYGGRAEIMDLVAPQGPVYQAGTLSGNPLAMTAGLATLQVLDEDPQIYELLEMRGARLERGLEAAAEEAEIPIMVQRVGSLLTPFFREAAVTDYLSARGSDTARYAKFFWGMLERGAYFPPSQFEAAFLSSAHTTEDIEETIGHAARVMKTI